MEDKVHSDAVRFNLVTFNCLGTPLLPNTRTRLQTIARELNQPSIDAVCLQEVQYSPYIPLLDKNFSRFPFMAFEQFFYAPKGGLLTFSRQPIEKTGFTLYPERGWWHTPSISDRMLHKGILLTEMNYAGEQIAILNTHLTANYNNNWSRSNRYALLEQIQLRQLAKVVNELNKDSIIIVAGDFNIPRGSWLYTEFVEATGMIDPLAEETKPTQYLSERLPDRFRVAIDHTFVRSPRRLNLTVQAELLFEEKVRLTSGNLSRLSDHMAIQLRLLWRRDGR